jgi:hypothetical protein
MLTMNFRKAFFKSRSKKKVNAEKKTCEERIEELKNEQKAAMDLLEEKITKRLADAETVRQADLARVEANAEARRAADLAHAETVRQNDLVRVEANAEARRLADLARAEELRLADLARAEEKHQRDLNSLKERISQLEMEKPF